ncbi:phosphodiester glycosidase family protein [Streptococcus caprae]|uniref:Phosphodiester glycosidase family protein n=1 Tax=Streptococcus caprae TaxID=1640501 RepID=A0ABV8CVA6_9STRE
MRFFKKHFFTLLCSAALLSASTYTLLKTFVLSEAISTVQATTSNSSTSSTSSSPTSSTTSTSTGEVTQTDTSYKDDNISVTITTGQTDDTTYYVADIQVSDASYLKTALANDTYGTNVTATTSSIAASNNAIFAINGDYYGANSTGYVIKNGVLYRDSSRNSDYEDLVVYSDGSFGTVNESDTTAQELLDSGVVQTFAFGPTLVKNGEIAVSTSEEVGQAMADNPRTAIGIIEESDGSLHYIVIVSDGRSDESAGLTLYEMAELMQSYGVTTAYNLDGGGSSTMYFNGQVVNKPTTNGTTIKERAVSDIVYIGY